ncbi:MAG: hypothetical protein ACRCY4_05025 [Brevinema sp.]
MKIYFSLIFFLLPITTMGQVTLTPLQNAVISENISELEALTAMGNDWMFIRKPTVNTEGELLLDFALANNKLDAYYYLLQKGVFPGVSTIFTAVKSRNYSIAQNLIENGGLRSYIPVRGEQPARLIFSNETSTNIRAIFNTNLMTNISQQASTSALGAVVIREYTNFVPFVNTNFYTNIQTRIITNRVTNPSTMPMRNNSPISFRSLTNIVVVTVTNLTNSYSPYNLTNALGIVLEREFTNVFPVIFQEIRTNLIQEPIPVSPPSRIEFQSIPIFLNRLQLIDLARLAESQGSSEFTSYFLEKAQSLK